MAILPSPIPERDRGFRIKADSLGVVGNSSVNISLLKESHRPMLVRQRMVGNEADRIGVLCDCLVLFPLLHVGIPPIEAVRGLFFIGSCSSGTGDRDRRQENRHQHNRRCATNMGPSHRLPPRLRRKWSQVAPRPPNPLPRSPTRGAAGNFNVSSAPPTTHWLPLRQTLEPKDQVQQPGRREGHYNSESRTADPVYFSRLILIMVSIGMGRGLSQGVTGSKPRSLCPSVGFSGRA